MVSMYVDMLMSFGRGSSEEGVRLLGIGSMGGVEVSQLVIGFRDSQSLSSSVNGGVHGTKQGEFEDDVFLAIAHDIEEMFLSDPFHVGINGASVADCTSFVCHLVHISDGDGGG